MTFILTKQFKKSFKALYKKFHSLPSDYKKFETEFSDNPELGADLGNGFRKVRISIQSKNKGKSGGGRIITYEMCIKQQENIIILIDIYDKSEQETISTKEYTDILKQFLDSDWTSEL